MSVKETATYTDGTYPYRSITRELPPSEYGKRSGEKLKETLRELPDWLGGDLGVLTPMRRLMAAIVLYVPNSLTNTYNVSWSEEDLTTGAIIDELASAGLKATKGGDLSGGVSDALGTGTAVIAGKVLDGSNYGQKALRATMGNSKAEQLFKGVDFRTFSFDYEFAPK